jgi:hypothetical protein
MDTALLLGRITCLRDLADLIGCLGHEPRWQDLPPEALPVPADCAAVVGQSGSFEWIAVGGVRPDELARRLSAALARRGRVVGVLALDPTARELAIGISLERTVVARVQLGHPAPADCERIRRLAALPRTGGVAFALRATEVLEGEDPGRRFFAAFREAVDRMAAGLAGPTAPSECRAVALIQLTRVLFLYFIQAKGWLDHRPDFLREAVDDALSRRRRLHRDLFQPLFFGTLNRQPAERGRARGFGRIPFLNGGLFEPHPLERACRLSIPDACWRDAFDRLFERFHFTVREGGDASRVAPDMLGRVFEGLMAPGDRRSSGAFYTPAALVTRMLDAALEAFVAERVGLTTDEARERLRDPDDQVRALLREITILDPAVGSGAFLLGALERLASLRAGEAPPEVLRRRILERNLFGVDLNPMAVRLTELRLWLAVIAVDPAAEPEQVAPLSNLDGLVRQGDSLLDPARSLALLGARPQRSAATLRELRAGFVQASGPDKRALLRRLRRAEARAFEECLEQASERLERDITECLTAARAGTLFGHRRGLDAELRRRLRGLRARLATVRRMKRRLERDGAVPWFSYEVHFGDVLARGGFDLVVGNPPWVRAEQLRPEVREQLAQRYRWWTARGRGFRHQPDLSLAFAERGMELLAPGGVSALLLPAKVATTGYARVMRGALAERCTVHAFANLTDDPVASFDATTYPAVLIAARAAPKPNHRVRLSLAPGAGHDCAQGRLTGGCPWPLATPGVLDALVRALAEHPTIGDRFTPQLGVKTGANAIFLDPPPEIEPALIRLGLRGRDIRPFIARTRVRLFFPHGPDGSPHRRLPEMAARHVSRHDAALRARVDYRGGPPWTLFRVRAAVALHRVVWPDLARRLSAAALTGPEAQGLIPLNSCYVLAAPDRATALLLTAWLNTTWLRALARATADPAASGFARFNARVIAGLPLPTTVLSDLGLARLAELAAGGQPVQEELDDVSAAHLSLSAADRRALAGAAGIDAVHRGRSAG